MKKKFIIYIIPLLLLAPVILSLPVNAACGGVETSIINCNDGEDPIWHIFTLILDIATGLIGILGVIGIGIVGVQYLTAKGDTARTTKAKRRLMEIVAGVVLFVFASAFTHWLLNPGEERPIFNPNSSSNSNSSGTARSVPSNVPLTSTKYRNKTVKIGKNKYRYDGQGNLVFGEKKIGKYWYYFDEKTGAMKRKGFKKINGKTYYYDAKGHKVFGQYFIKNKAYYFDPKTGEQYTGKLYFGVRTSKYKSIRKLTPDMIASRAKEVVDYVRKTGKFHYNDSGSYPPSTDNYISCERLASVVLYSYGFTDQPRDGGYKIANGFLDWLRRLGFRETHSLSDIKKGSIVWLRWTTDDGGVGHVFIAASRVGSTFKRYDTGSESRFSVNQPVTTDGFPYNIVNNDLSVFNLP